MSSKVEFHVNMNCNNCVDKISKKLADEKGIDNFDVDLNKGTVVVQTSLPTDQVKSIIESTGKKALVKGLGDYKSAVAIVNVGNERINGVVRFMQASVDACIIDGTIDGLDSGSYKLDVHECGDISDGCNSVGDLYKPDQKDTKPDMGQITTDSSGRSMFRMIQEPMLLSNLIGRSVVVKGPQNQRLACGIIARSAGLFENPKQICACDGVSLWDELKKPKQKSTL